MRGPTPGEPADEPGLTLHLVRDGSTYRSKGRCIGQTDARLSQTGRKECRILARQLSQRPDRFFSSDLSRARETATILTADVFEVDPRLRDMHFGVWDGLSWEEIDAMEGPVTDTWSMAWPVVRAPGGESFDDVVRRMRSWIGSLPRDGSECLAIAHAASIRAAAVVLLDFPAERVMSLTLDHARVSTFFLSRTGSHLIRWNAPGF